MADSTILVGGKLVKVMQNTDLTYSAKAIMEDGDNETLGTKADEAVTDPTLSASEIAILKGLMKQLQGTGTGALPVSGSVDIDQTTDGTTNRVVSKISQTEGENVVSFGATAQPVSVTGSLANNVTDALPVQLSGSNLAEQLDQDDAVANVLTFSANISAIEIYHEEATWQTFTVNGLTLNIPAGGYRTPIGGTPAATVTIPVGVSCLVGRLI